MIRALVLPVLILIAGDAGAACARIDHKNVGYTVCDVAAGGDLRLWHGDPQGNPLGSFHAVERGLKEGERLVFAMNAGMYRPDRRPVGLFIEEYRERTPLTDGGGYGNFGMVPNGVFCIFSDRFRTIETGVFRETRPACRFATQSGPMVVVDGVLHPRLLPDSSSRHVRNGVGTSADGTRAVFAISERPVNFHDFATLFRDRLGLPDALYFDGGVSRLFARELGRDDIGPPMGPIVGLVARPGN